MAKPDAAGDLASREAETVPAAHIPAAGPCRAKGIRIVERGPARGEPGERPSPIRSAIALAAPIGRLHGQDTHEPLIEALLRRLAVEARGIPTSLLIENAVILVIATLLRRDFQTTEPRPKGLGSVRMHRLVAYIGAHLADDITIGDLAAVACLSPYHFARAFKRETGLTPRAFVMKRRVEHAKALLSSSDMSLAQIGYECGFATQAHFTTVFKRQVGVTPGAYRQTGTTG